MSEPTAGEYPDRIGVVHAILRLEKAVDACGAQIGQLSRRVDAGFEEVRADLKDHSHESVGKKPNGGGWSGLVEGAKTVRGIAAALGILTLGAGGTGVVLRGCGQTVHVGPPPEMGPPPPARTVRAEP